MSDEVIGSPVLRLRAERDTLKKDLEAAKADVKAATTQIAKDAASALVEGLEKKLAGVGSALSKAQKNAAKETKAIQDQLDRLNATKATASMGLLEKAVNSVGGTSRLSADQVKILTTQVERLAAAGAKIPKSLVIPKASPGLGAGLEAGLQSAGGSLGPGGALGAGLTAIGPAGIAAAAGIGAIGLAATAAGNAMVDFVAKGSKIQDLKEKTLLSTDAIQDFAFIAEQSGVSLDDLADTAVKLQKTIGEAELGGPLSDAGKKLAALGLSAEDFKGLKIEDSFVKFAGAVRNVTDENVAVALASEVAGKGFKNVAAVVRTDLVTALQQAQQSGTRLSEDQVKQADEIGDAFTRLGKTSEALKLQLGGALLGALGGGDVAHGVDTVTNAAKGLLDIVKDPKFQAFLNFASGGTLGLAAGGIKGLAEEGQFKNLTVLSDKQIEQKNAVTGPDLFTELSGDATLRAKAKEAAEDQKKAQAAAEAYERELERLAEEEKRGAIEANKRWEEEGKAVEKVNEAVAKRLSGAEVSIFGTSKDAARDASLAFDDFNTVMERAKKGVDDLSVNELTKLEAQLAKLEPLTRADADANKEVADALDEVQQRLAVLNEDYDDFTQVNIEAEKASKKLADTLAKSAQKWADLAMGLGAVVSVFGDISGSANGVVAAIGKIGGSLAKSAQGFAEWKKAQATGGLTTGQKIQAGAASVGAVESIIEQGKTERTAFGGYNQGAQKGMAAGSAYGPYGAAAGAFIGGLIGLFAGSKFRDEVKKIGRVLGKLGKDVTDEEVKQIEELGKKAHVGIEDAARLYKRLKDDSDAVAKRETLRAGVDNAVQSANDLANSLKDASPDAAKSAAVLFMDTWQAEMRARGPAAAAAALGPALDELEKQLKDKGLDTSFLAGLEHQRTLGSNAQYAGASSLATSEAGIINGLRDAGLVDQSLMGHAAQGTQDIYNQAVAAATAAGDAPAEATKDGLRAVSELLEAQLNASIASGTKLDSGTQALIDLAKQNGIDILADPAIESLAVEKEQLAVLKTLAGIKGSPAGSSDPGTVDPRSGPYGRVPGFAGGTGGRFLDFGRGTSVMLHGLEAVVRPSDVTASLRVGSGSGSASLNGGPPSGVSQVNHFHIHDATDPKRTADAVVIALEGQHHKLNAVLNKRYR